MIINDYIDEEIDWRVKYTFAFIKLKQRWKAFHVFWAFEVYYY